MPRHRPPTSGYARLAQADEEDENGSLYEDDGNPQILSASAPQYAPIQPRPHGHMRVLSDDSKGHPKRPGSARRRERTNSSVDIKAINARLERWADEIASKFKIKTIKGKSHDEEQLEIHHSVFQPPDGVRLATVEALQLDVTEAQGGRITKPEFDNIVESVRTAIELGVHPKMITQGSSGSYFARNPAGKVVGVFKPKDEEPYASRNPKWTKWIHRNLFPCFFGRACLIPNLSYVSEAAAYVLDSRLRTNIVPYTDVVHLSSKVFYYDFWQRSAFYRKRKPLPEKPGSFQVFLQGFKDANIFLRDHPWPDQYNTGFRPGDAPKRKKRPWTENCKPSIAQSDDEDEAQPDSGPPSAIGEPQQPRFYWTEPLKQSFREELEKLVILDYIMRNTDRGLDNWMVKIDWASQEASIVSEPPGSSGLGGHADDHAHPVPRSNEGKRLSEPYRRHEAMATISRSGSVSSVGVKTAKMPKLTIGAIDNSLSWPWKHPDAWRSFPFGWLFLPVSLIGQPFSKKTRDHFLPLLTSTEWWSGTQIALRRVFEQDSDFTERMFARQISVVKGQAWNVVETLKTPDHGPLELTRRSRVCVWDDIVDIPVAIPLRTPSAEMRQRTESSAPSRLVEEEEEMDISAANDSVPHTREDLIRLSPEHELPNPNRFELSRNPSASDMGSSTYEADDTSDNHHGEPLRHEWQRKDSAMDASRPGAPDAKARVHAAKHDKGGGSGSGRVGLSLSNRHNSFLYDGDDEGDLGYGKARHAEGSTRKVIVERLETVKSKAPVFTWC